jgi:hypothetical protein
MKTFENEFSTINLILSSSFETKGVDAFSLSMIKADKQIRRIFTFLIFQNDAFTKKDVNSLINVLAKNNKVYSKELLFGIDFILQKPISEVYGIGFDEDLNGLKSLVKIRNKISHGQITDLALSREKLVEKIDFIKKWCQTLGDSFQIEIGYNGFSNSFVKSEINLQLNNVEKFSSLEKYSDFLKDYIERK